MKVIVTAVGSVGDVYPFLAIARVLKARTPYEVVFVGNERFREPAERDGVEFHAHGSVDDYDRSLTPPDGNLKNPFTLLKGVKSLTYFNFFKPIGSTFSLIDQHRSRDTLLIAHGASFGARLARDAFGIPMISGILSPTAVPGNVRRSFDRLALMMGNSLCKQAINRFCSENDLPTIARVDGWSLSPDGIAALYPDLLVEEDSRISEKLSTARVSAVGYLPYATTAADTTDRLSRFIGDHPTILFTPGTSIRNGHRYLKEAVEVCRDLGVKGVLVTDYAKQLPGTLPDYVTSATYASFRQVFPMCAAIVHHGGLGTSMECVAAGRPQLIVPQTADQPYNAARLKSLGVAEVLPMAKFRAQAATSKLRSLLQNDAVEHSCRSLQDSLRRGDAQRNLVELVASVIDKGRAAARR
jgi:UDP:flavonoid glycosyltransferase YjiC (YdhE family)